MKKNGRIESLIGALGPDSAWTPGDADRCYLAYFQLFNAQRYFDAHEVLEHLWLSRRHPSGPKDPDSDFFKGLIQVAGAFVHLQKQFFGVNRPKDAHRLHPASRLFALAKENLISYRPVHISLDVEEVVQICRAQIDAIAASDYQINPWRPENAPELKLKKR